MKALSIRNPYAQLIIQGYKPFEIRSRPTKYRGDILVCASRQKVFWYAVHNPNYRYNSIMKGVDDLYKHCGFAIGIVRIVDCRPMTPEDAEFAFCKYEPGKWAYVLEDPRCINPFDVCGNLGFFNVDPPIHSQLFDPEIKRAMTV